MAKRKKNKRDKVDVQAVEPATHNPFAAALAGMSAPEAELPDQPAREVESSPTPLPAVKTRVERKGRGGKTVTLVSGLEALDGGVLDDVARRLRKALGTGVTTEDGLLVVQGDQRDRVTDWFDAERG